MGSDTAPTPPLGALNGGVGTACLGKESGWRGQKLRALKSCDVNKAGEGFLKKKTKELTLIDYHSLCVQANCCGGVPTPAPQTPELWNKTLAHSQGQVLLQEVPSHSMCALIKHLL